MKEKNVIISKDTEEILTKKTNEFIATIKVLLSKGMTVLDIETLVLKDVKDCNPNFNIESLGNDYITLRRFLEYFVDIAKCI